MAEAIISDALSSNTEHYRHWLREAVDILGERTDLVLRYHPNLETTATSILPMECKGTRLKVDPALPPGTLRLSGSEGAVEYAWRDALLRLKGTSS